MGHQSLLVSCPRSRAGDFSYVFIPLDFHIRRLTTKRTATAKICNVPYNSDPTIQDNVNYLLVSNQADLDAAFAGCTTINGDILISNTYTGGFNLSEVVSMNGTIKAYNYLAGITFMELDNLITFTGLFYIQGALDLQNISMASAAFMSYMQLENFDGGTTNLDFPELVNVTTFEIYGQFGR